MKRRQYLVEDLSQIQRYFPGAQPDTLRTPFDLTVRPTRPRLIQDIFRDQPVPARWKGALSWMN
jgi:hypothetical protein